MPDEKAASTTTNKTEFMRYLNDHESEVASLAPHVRQYRSLGTRGNNFGYWLRCNRRDIFLNCYAHYWLKHPELHTQVYA